MSPIDIASALSAYEHELEETKIEIFRMEGAIRALRHLLKKSEEAGI
jgi:hypothetical protein